MKKLGEIFSLLSLIIILVGCGSNTKKDDQQKVDKSDIVILTDAQLENIVKRSYQYVTMFNVNNKFALKQGGWNTIDADTKLKDHTMTDLARPNNDSFYTIIMLDLRKEPFIVNLPSFDSKYVSLMVTAYDHYVNVPKSTTKNDFQKNEKILFYSDRTENYDGEELEGVDNIMKVDGDFISVVFRIMPHVNEPKRFAGIIDQIGKISMQSLSEYNGGTAKKMDEINFPQIGVTDLDVFENNYAEVMQFVVNHLSFDSSVEMDREFLAAVKPLGIVPGNLVNGQTSIPLDGKKLRAIAEKIRLENLVILSNPETGKTFGPISHRSKKEATFKAVVAASVLGPIGLPITEAFYPNVTTIDGSPMNALNDYVIKFTKEGLPPANAFWSLTLYDNAQGFFIPNEHKKYSVGENGGMKLNEDGGIEIYVAAEKPEGVPKENWLPINRGDEVIDLLLRVYAPQLDKINSWKAPKAEKL